MKTRNLLILIAFVVSLGFNVYSFNSGALFKDGDVNALSLNLIVDKDQLNIAVKSIKTTKSGIDKKTGSGLYILQTFCPDDCSAW